MSNWKSFNKIAFNCESKNENLSQVNPKGSLSERYGRTFSNARISNISKCKHLNQKLSKFQLFEFLNVIMEHAAHSRWLRYGTLGLLYFVQGAPYGFQTACLPLILRQAGLSFTGMLSYHDSGLEYHATSNWCFKTFLGGNLEILDFP